MAIPTTSDRSDDPAVVPTLIWVDADCDGPTIHIDGANGLYGDRSVSWDFVIGIIGTLDGRDWSNGRGYSARRHEGMTIVTMPASAVRHGISFPLNDSEVRTFGNACVAAAQAGDSSPCIDVARVDALWGDEPTSPVVRARVAERLRLAA